MKIDVTSEVINVVFVHSCMMCVVLRIWMYKTSVVTP